jgi:hypothetical protein
MGYRPWMSIKHPLGTRTIATAQLLASHRAEADTRRATGLTSSIFGSEEMQF